VCRRTECGDGRDAARKGSLLADYADGAGVIGGSFVEEVGECLGAEKATVHRPRTVAATDA
jgi:hypothetical protein